LNKIALVIYYHKQNFYSLNAIAGALETDPIFDKIDFFFSSLNSELMDTLKDLVKSYDKVVVGISFFTSQLFETHDLIQEIKKKFDERCLLVAGGSHPTGDPFGTLEIGFNIVVVGEGEETIIELMQKIKSDENLNAVRGIAYKNRTGEHILTKKRSLINLNDYPPFPLKNTRYGAIEITRGCPYICYFCQIPHIVGTTPRHRSIENIGKYVKELYNHYGDLTDIRFITPNAFSYGSESGKSLNLELLENLLIRIRKIIDPKGRIYLGTFPSEVRPEHVTQDTIDLVLKYGNNDNITIGAQSGSQKILDLCHRGHTVEDVYRAVELTLKNNLKINVDFIFGLPDEDDEDIQLTIAMMKDLSDKGARIHAHSFIPLPQTPFSKKPIRRISGNYKKEVKELISKGLAFGNWKEQERLAMKIAEYLKSKK
jgi:B12-binding domain/radical SAM domain protein